MSKQTLKIGAHRLRRLTTGLRGRAGQLLGWLLVALMSIVLLNQISILTNRNYRVYDLEATRTGLLRERQDLVLQLGALQQLADLATTATAVGLQPAAPEQWTVLNAPTQEARP